MLGISGDAAELVKAEDGSYWLGDMGVMSGSTTMSSNGNTYRLDMADGAWMATFVPMEMMIGGTGLTAMTREDQGGYDVAGGNVTLTGTAAGQLLTVSGGMHKAYYRVWMADGGLTGARTDRAGTDANTEAVTIGLWTTTNGFNNDDAIAYNGNDRDTVVNEGNTKLNVAGESLPLGDLFGMGGTSKPATAADGGQGDFVREAVEELESLLAEAELYATRQAGDPIRNFDDNLTEIAEDAQDAINKIFDRDPRVFNVTVVAGTTPDADAVFDEDLAIRAGLPSERMADRTTAVTDAATNMLRAADTVRGLKRLLDALSSADKFVEATAAGENGIFEGAFGESAARNAYSANESSYDVMFGQTENTRFGAITLMDRKSNPTSATDPDPDTMGRITPADTDDDDMAVAAARYGMRFAFDGADADTDEEVGSLGAFAYSTLGETARSRDLPQTGGATYEGETIAATPGTTAQRENQLYRGAMRIDVNFRRGTVVGRVSELKDEDNNLWQFLDRDVQEIYLPQRVYNGAGIFGQVSGRTSNDNHNPDNGDDFGTATIVYSDTHGFPLPTSESGTARFSGRFIGSTGNEITGVWSLGDPRVGQIDFDNDDDLTDETMGSDPRDILYGAYGVTRAADRGVGAVPGEDDVTEVGASILPAGTTIDTDNGLLKFGSFARAGTDDEAQFELSKVFAGSATEVKSATFNGPKFTDLLRAEIQKQRALYEAYMGLADDTAATTDVQNIGRQMAWRAINDAVRELLFGLNSLYAYDPTAATPNNANLFVGATYTVGNTANFPTAQDSEAALGSLIYPMTRTGQPDDAAALAAIDALLDALANSNNFQDAFILNGGGVFDNAVAQDITWRTPFPADEIHTVSLTDGSTTGAADSGERTSAQMYNLRSALVKIRSLSTDYTGFGVWWREESPFAAENLRRHVIRTRDAQASGNAAFGGTPASTAGAEGSPNSYAYSWLAQSAYRTDRIEQTYPSEGYATYTGKALGLVDSNLMMADATVRVGWESPINADGTLGNNSTMLPTFTGFRDVADGDPLVDRGLTGGRPGEIVENIQFGGGGAGNAFVALAIDHGANGELGYMTDTGDVLVARLTYSDGRTVDLTGDSLMFEAKFLGESLDGPLGVTGIFSIAPSAVGAATNAGFGVGASPNTNQASGQHPTRGNLHGSFGADLTSFETLIVVP